MHTQAQSLKKRQRSSYINEQDQAKIISSWWAQGDDNKQKQKLGCTPRSHVI
jgi:hypothetical protein